MQLVCLNQTPRPCLFYVCSHATCGSSDTLCILQDAATRQELYRLGVLQFLVDEMKGHSSVPQFLREQSHGLPWPRGTTAGSKSPSPDRVPGRLNSLQSPARSKPCYGYQSSCSVTAVSPEKAVNSVTRSPTLRIPTLRTDSQAETADRGGALHIPASAPTSSGHSSPHLTARRALSLAPALVANPTPMASPSKQPFGPLPPQSPPNNPTASKQSASQVRPAKQSAGAFWDENRPIGGLVSPDSPRNDEIPAWFQPCGDLNEDIEQWEGQEKEVCYCSCKHPFHNNLILETRPHFITYSTTVKGKMEAGSLSSMCTSLGTCQ